MGTYILFVNDSSAWSLHSFRMIQSNSTFSCTFSACNVIHAGKKKKKRQTKVVVQLFHCPCDKCQTQVCLFVAREFKGPALLACFLAESHHRYIFPRNRRVRLVLWTWVNQGRSQSNNFYRTQFDISAENKTLQTPNLFFAPRTANVICPKAKNKQYSIFFFFPPCVSKNPFYCSWT